MGEDIRLGAPQNFDTVANKAFADAVPSSADAPPADLKRIGRYRIEKVLGKGGFGLVYLGYDEQLDRLVAIKVPHAELISKPEDATAYLAEARTVAKLDHPGIVPVHDVGSTDECVCFVVSKYIPGTDLAVKLKEQRLKYREAAELVATVAEAMHYAHKQGLVHRDIKPGNILIGRDGRPFIVDFGLALREENIGKGPKFAGTPAYMSPEQARGEGHRVDGRSDIFSLGVVLYEMLAGRRPFQGDTLPEIMEQVTNHEPRPLRQYDEKLPKELDRICHKAMSKRVSERYSSAHDLAEDLRLFLVEQSMIHGGVSPGGAAAETKGSILDTTPVGPTPNLIPSAGIGLSTDSSPLRIVPKGLRSFDAHDADFFLELLPGPRDREGLPDSLRFWKTRIEETDADNTFSVGLIYGPSGCGKSSLVKAGLLPRLSTDVIAVYVEATPEETETRLLHGLRKRCPALDDTLNLKDTLAALRRGQGIPVGRKVLIVVDQFEQWLHAKKDEENTALVQALRQCDGSRVQCIVMVRDDFWMAATRFMRELEVRLVEAQNSAAVDLFPIRHAQKVLTAFGRAFGTLPDHLSELNKQQKSFLEESIAGLSQEGKVVCVRLALFSEMMKSKPWTPAALKEVGGTTGVGVTFLDETFSASTAPPEHRYHQKAARTVLKTLLPVSGTDIKGEMKSYAELLEASGYGNRPKDFDDLIRILDSEIRLITPTDPEGVEGGEWRVERGGADGSKTLPGTGGLAARHGSGGELLRGNEKFSEGRSVWSDQSDSAGSSIDTSQHRRRSGEDAHSGISQLPEHRTGVADGSGNTPDAQQESGAVESGRVGQADGTHGPDQPHAQRTAKGARTATQSLIPPTTHHRAPSTGYFQLTHDYLVPSLREWLTRKQKESRRGRAELKLDERTSIWNVKRENKQLPTVAEWLSIRTLTDSKRWTEPQRAMMQRATRMQALNWGSLLLAVLLVGTGIQQWTSSVRWKNLQDQTRAAAESLQNNLGPSVPVNLKELGRLPKELVLPELQTRFASAESARHKLSLAFALASYGQLEAEYLVSQIDAVAEADTRNFVTALQADPAASLASLKAEAVKCIDKPSWRRKTRLTIAALGLGDTELALDMCTFESRPDPEQRTLFVDEFRHWNVDLKVVLAAVEHSDSPAMRSGICLAVGQVPGAALADADKEAWKTLASQWFAEQADTSTHSAAGWLLRQWGVPLPEILKRSAIIPERNWFVNSVGSTMLRIRPVTPASSAVPDPVQKYRQQLVELKNAEAAKQENPEDRDARAIAYFYTGSLEEALQDLNFLVTAASAERQPTILQYRTLTLARLGRGAEAQTSLAAYLEADAPASYKTYMQIQVPAWLGDIAEATRQLESAIGMAADDQDALYNIACAAALCGQATVKVDGDQSRMFADQAFTLLQRLTKLGYVNVDQLSQDPDFASLHGDARFASVLLAMKPPLGEFWVADREVTRGQFEQFVNDAEYPSTEKPADWSGLSPEYSPTTDHPAHNVSWYDAVLYCNWLSQQESRMPCYERTGTKEKDGYSETEYDAWRIIPGATGYRLPGDEEWEYACRAGTQTDFSSGDDESLLVGYCQMIPSKLPAVCGQRLPNAWGLHDVHGNVWEWCWDLYHAGDSYRVSRGGSWSDGAAFCRSATRGRSYPSGRGSNTGFRLALSPSGVSAEQAKDESAEPSGAGTEEARR